MNRFFVKFILLEGIILLLNFVCFSQLSHRASVRVAVAGISHGHSSWIFGKKSTPDIEVVGIFEKDAELVEVYSKKYNLDKAIFYTDFDKMLDKLKPEAVLSFNPTNEHLSVIESCAPRGIHVMVEKPLATSPFQVTRIIELAKRYNIQVLTNYETSWYPSTEKTYQLVNDSDFLGSIRKVIIRDGHEGARNTEANKFFFRWLTDPVKNGGGALTDFGCYGANLMTFLMKNQRPLSVIAITRQFKPEIYPNVDDEATIIVSYPNAQCIIEASWNWPFNRKDMEVYGETGYIIAENDSLVHFRNKKMKSEETKKYSAKDMNIIDNPFSYFTRVIRGEIKVPINGTYSLDNNKLVVEILDAAKKSAKTGKVVYFKK